MRGFGQVLKDAILQTDTVLDIGCGDKRNHNLFRCANITTVDAWEKVKPHYVIDLENEWLPFGEKSFDVVLMLDFIEHLEKSRGLEIIDQCKSIARKKIILFTPLWWDKNEKHTNNPDKWCYGNEFNLHKSLWSVEDFKGWRRYGDVQNHLTRYWYGEWRRSDIQL